jgi:membrane-associated phospholipid phosphatase
MGTDFMKSPYKINLILLIIFLLSFALVLTLGANRAVFIDINSFATSINPFIWENLTYLGDTLAVCAIMLLFIRKRPDLIWSGIFATIIATLIVNIIKLYFNLPRPPVMIEKNLINIIGPALSSHSFPSGHTVTIFTLTGILMFYFRSFLSRFCLIILACLVGISRIAVGVHWPEDVLAGASLGILCAITGVIIVSKLGWNKNKPVQLIIGFILILSNIYLLIFYDCRYEQAIYLQSVLAFSVLVAGTREYYLLLKNE